MDNRGKISGVLIIAMVICVGISGYVAYDWWTKTSSASASTPISPGGPNAPHGSVGADYLAVKIDGTLVGLTWDSPANPGIFSLYTNSALSVFTGNGIQIQSIIVKIWIDPTYSGAGNAGGVKVTIPVGVFAVDKVVPLNTKTVISEFRIFSASDIMSPGTHDFNLTYVGTCQAIAAGTTSALIGDASGFNFSDTVTVIYR